MVKAGPPVLGQSAEQFLARGTKFYREFGRCCLVPGASLRLFLHDV